MVNKNEVKGFVKKILDKMTVSQARIFTIVVTALVLLLFLATSGGRSIIGFLAYVGFIGGTLYGGYRLYKYTTENAHGDQKQGKTNEEKASRGTVLSEEPYDPFFADDTEGEDDVEHFEDSEEENTVDDSTDEPQEEKD